MCPDPQLLSVYVDGELPSPWKEKMEAHLSKCSVCREKVERFKGLFANKQAEEQTLAQRLTTEAKDRIWKNLQTRSSQQFRSRSSLWRRRLSIPLPAAAALVFVVLAVFFVRYPFADNVNVENLFSGPSNVILAAEEEMPDFPVADLNDVFQFLASDGTSVIIMELPENRSFLRSGEPAIVRAADFSRRFP
jgi:anti-sigma-K factor RskA